MTLSEGLGWLKTLQGRQAELINLRNVNSRTTTTRYRTPGEPDEVNTPEYDAKKLDKRVTLIGREIRLLSDAIKRTNAIVEVTGFVKDEEVLGELE